MIEYSSRVTGGLSQIQPNSKHLICNNTYSVVKLKKISYMIVVINRAARDFHHLHRLILNNLSPFHRVSILIVTSRFLIFRIVFIGRPSDFLKTVFFIVFLSEFLVSFYII